MGEEQDGSVWRDWQTQHQLRALVRTRTGCPRDQDATGGFITYQTPRHAPRGEGETSATAPKGLARVPEARCSLQALPNLGDPPNSGVTAAHVQGMPGNSQGRTGHSPGGRYSIQQPNAWSALSGREINSIVSVGSADTVPFSCPLLALVQPGPPLVLTHWMPRHRLATLAGVGQRFSGTRHNAHRLHTHAHAHAAAAGKRHLATHT